MEHKITQFLNILLVLISSHLGFILIMRYTNGLIDVEHLLAGFLFITISSIIGITAFIIQRNKKKSNDKN